MIVGVEDGSISLWDAQCKGEGRVHFVFLAISEYLIVLGKVGHVKTS